MKKVIFFGMIVTLVIISCAKQKSQFPQGAWQTVQVQSIVDGNAEILYPGLYTGNQYKIWSETKWMALGRYKQDTLSLDVYGGGTYTIDGNQYIENVLYHSNKIFEGLKLNMTLELRNDTLIQTYHGVDLTGKLNDTIYLEKSIQWK